MAARRLKFKPKPLVGLIRRNKEQNNEQENASNNDVLLSESNTLTVNKNEHDEKSLVDGGLDQRKEVSSKQNDLESLSSQNSVNSNSKIIDSDNLKNVTQTDSFLKSVINNKIKSVLSNNFSDSLRTNPGVSSESTVCSDNFIETNKFTEIDKITNISDAISCSTKNVNDLEHPESHSENALQISNNNISGVSKSFTTDTVPNDQDLQRNDDSVHISSATTDLTVSDNNELQNSSSLSQNKINTSQGSEPDKKDNKSTNQCQRLPRFGKRIKPVLSNIVRKKDLENKPEDTTVPEISVPPTTPKTISKDDESIISVSESVVNIEKSVEKENVDKNIVEHTVLYSDKEPVSLMKQTSSEDTEQLDSLNRSDPLTDNENEVDQSVRSPVKIFSPKKRQRSQATSSSSTIVKAFQSFKDKFKDGNMDKKKLIMRDLIFYNPTTNPMREITPGGPKKEMAKHENETKSLLDEKLEEEKIDDIDNEEAESMPVPQVKVGPDGKIIIDPKSLVIEATGIQKNRANLENSEVVQENEYSYSKFNKRKVRRIEWSAEETLLFYKSLNDLGADFSLMQSLFPKKTRKDLKVKFKKEEKLNSHLIDKAMRSCSKFDFAALEKELQKDREERVRKLEEIKRLKEEKKKERLEKKPQPRKKTIKRKSDALREFDEGDSGVVRVGKKYEDKVHKILEFKRKQINNEDSNSAAKLKKNNLSSKRQSKKNTLEKENNIEVPGLYPKTSFDFRLFASDDEDETTSEIYDKQNSDNDSVDDNIFQRILTTTRSGRQPKSALNKRKVSPVKVAEHNNNKKLNKKSRNSGHGESNVEIIYENGKQFSVISNAISPENLDQYYTLFAEPLDLSHANGVEDDSNQSNGNLSINKDNLENNILYNENTMVPIINSDISTEILNSAFSSESLNHKNSINNRTSERNLSESLQIMEELTVGNDNTNDSNFNNNEQMNENGDYSLYILPEIETNVNRDDDNNTNDNCVVQSENTNFDEYSTTENLTDDNNYRDVQNHLPPIIINASQISSETYLSSQPQIQFVPKEQINYILGQNSNVIFRSGIGDHNNLDDSRTENNEDDSPISHSSIHCYPSSDHTYTSLKPLPPVKKNTFVILSSLNSENVTCEQPRSTIVLYPT